MVVDLDSQRGALKEIADVEMHIIQHPSIPQDECTKLQQDVKNLQATAENLAERAQPLAARCLLEIKCLFINLVVGNYTVSLAPVVPL